MSLNQQELTGYPGMNAENITNFDSFEVEHIPKEIRKFIGNKNISVWFNNVWIFLYWIY